MNNKILLILLILSGFLALYGEVSILMRTDGYDALYFELASLIFGMLGIMAVLYLVYSKKKQMSERSDCKKGSEHA